MTLVALGRSDPWTKLDSVPASEVLDIRLLNGKQLASRLSISSVFGRADPPVQGVARPAPEQIMLAQLDCFAGIAGDMLVGAVLDAGVPFEKLSAAVAALRLNGVRIDRKSVVRGGITATRFLVEVDSRERDHRGLSDLLSIVARAALTPTVQRRVERTLIALAEAEASVHGTPVDAVHFHEVGGDDAIVDVVCACVGLDALSVNQVVLSAAVEVGRGTVTTAHGVLPIPAPATALLLSDRAMTQDVDGEATTPTGAALLVGWESLSSTSPPSSGSGARSRGARQVAMGYGAGQREVLGRPNVVRLRILEPVLRRAPSGGLPNSDTSSDEWIYQLECQVDTATGERLGHVLRRVFECGGLDAYVTPVLMKKGRPGHLVTAWANEMHLDAVRDLLLEDATTLGVRMQPVQRACLARWTLALETRWGTVLAKVVRLPSGVLLARPEADDVERLVAAGHGSYAAIEAELLIVAQQAALDDQPRFGDPD